MRQRNREDRAALLRFSAWTRPPCSSTRWRTIERPSPVPPGIARARFVHAVEALEYTTEIGLRHAGPVIANRQEHPPVPGARAQLDAPAFCRIVHRVLDEISQRVVHLCGIGFDDGGGRFDRHVDADFLPGRSDRKDPPIRIETAKRRRSRAARPSPAGRPGVRASGDHERGAPCARYADR